MYINYKKDKINNNFRNNQNYIISDLDKKYIIYNVFERKNRYILKFILNAFFMFFVILYTVYDVALKELNVEPINFNINFIGKDIILYIALFIAIFILFITTLYFIISIINYGFTIRLIKKIRYIFKSKTKGILLKKHPKGKYREIYSYFYHDRHELNYRKRIKEEIENDFIYIKNT